MGAEASTESGEEFLRGFQNKYSFTKEINDSRFGDIQIYKENGGEGFVFLKSQWCQSEEDYNLFLKQCQRRVNSPHRNVLKMIGYSQSSDTQLCGDFSKITVYYEYYPHNMERELDRRNTRSEYFNEQEIWFLLESVISACAYFESQKIYHGDLRPQNILLTNEGFVKIADHGLVHSDKNAYIKALQYGEQTYLSPNLMRGLGNRETNPVHNVFKSDVYSLGMTMLEVCNLYTARSCYDYNSAQIIKPVVDDLLMRGRQRYSEFLMNIVSDLIQEDEQNRPTFQELQQILAPYQDAIQNLQPFTPSQFSTLPQQNLIQTQQQPMFQSQIQHQPIGAQSQIIYQQNPQGHQPYITSPENARKQQEQVQPQHIIPNSTLQQSQIQHQPYGGHSQYIPQQQVIQQLPNAQSPPKFQQTQSNLALSQTGVQQPQQQHIVYQQQPQQHQQQQPVQSQTLPSYQQPIQQQQPQQQQQVYQPSQQQPQQSSPQFQSPSQQQQYVYQQPQQEYQDINQRVDQALRHTEETIKHSTRVQEPVYQQQPQQHIQQQQYQQPIYQHQPPQYQQHYQ